jgi:hypothetical protein
MSCIKKKRSWEWWYTPMIPATQEVEVERSLFEVNPGKVSTGPYLE